MVKIRYSCSIMSKMENNG